MRDAQVDEARFFDTGDHFDRVTERGARAIEERPLALRTAQSVRAHDANALGLHVLQALAELLGIEAGGG